MLIGTVGLFSCQRTLSSLMTCLGQKMYAVSVIDSPFESTAFL